MAYVSYVIEIPNEAVGTLTAEVQFPTNPDEMLNNSMNLFNALAGGVKNGTIQVTISADAITVSAPSDPGSSQVDYSKA